MHINMKSRSSQKLRRALLANAIFSAICGSLMVFAEPSVLSWLGLKAISIRPIGVFLMGFSLYLIWMMNHGRVPKSLVSGVIAGDWAWVMGSIILLMLNANLFSWLGILLVTDVAVVVAVFAILQGLGLRQASATAHNSAPAMR